MHLCSILSFQSFASFKIEETLFMEIILYRIAEGCAEAIISVSLLSKALRSSQATCSSDILKRY